MILRNASAPTGWHLVACTLGGEISVLLVLATLWPETGTAIIDHVQRHLGQEHHGFSGGGHGGIGPHLGRVDGLPLGRACRYG